MTEAVWIPAYPGPPWVRNSEDLRKTIEIFKPCPLDNSVAEELSTLTKTAQSHGIKIVQEELPPPDPNLYLGIGTEIPVQVLAEFLSGLSRSMSGFTQRSSPLRTYVYDIKKPGEKRFRLDDDDQLQLALEHFLSQNEGV